MKKTFIIIFAVICAIVFLASAIYIMSQPREAVHYVKVVEGDSVLYDFEKVEGTVRIYCKVVLENITETDLKVKLYAYVPVENKSEVFNGIDKSGNGDAFLVQAGSVKAFEIAFVYEYDGEFILKDRSLPEIIVDYVL